MRVSQPFSASCSAWTTTFRLGALPIPLGMTVSIGTLLAALYAGHRGTGDYRGKISLAASIATIMLVLIFALLLTVARGAGGGIGVLISLCGLVWQAIPAAHGTQRSEGLVANYYRLGLTCGPEIDPGRLAGRRRAGSNAVQKKPTNIV